MDAAALPPCAGVLVQRQIGRYLHRSMLRCNAQALSVAMCIVLILLN